MSSGNGNPAEDPPLQQFPTIELVEELQRRKRLLSAPEKRIVIAGGSAAASAAVKMHQSEGYCLALTPNMSSLWASGKIQDEEAVTSIKQTLKLPQCRRGWILAGAPKWELAAEAAGGSVDHVFLLRDRSPEPTDPINAPGGGSPAVAAVRAELKNPFFSAARYSEAVIGAEDDAYSHVSKEMAKK